MPPSQELRIPTEKITPFLDTMTRRLKKQGFSVADRCDIPQNNNHFYLPITEEAEQNKQVIPSIIATQYVLEDINSKVAGMIAYSGTFDYAPKTINELGIEPVGRIETGIWAYLYELGKTEDPHNKLTKNEINKDIMAYALDPKKGLISISKWAASAVACPVWLDKKKATAIEVVAAAYAAKNTDKIMKKLNEKGEEKDKAKMTSKHDAATGEVTLYVGSLTKLLAPIALPLILALNRSFLYEVASKILAGRTYEAYRDDLTNLYRKGVVRTTDEKNGTLQQLTKLLEEKEK